MTASEKELLEIEKGFWALGEAYFKAHADKECLVAFPDMAMAMSNADLAATAKNPTAGAISRSISRVWSNPAAMSSC
jgi:hypothetical protein